MDKSEIRLKLFQQIDQIDPTKLEELYAVMQNYVQGKWIPKSGII